MPSKRPQGPHPVDVHVGAMVRLRRHELGVSQSQLGEMIGVSFQQVQKYERGSNRVSASVLLQMATGLGVLPSYFLDSAPGLLNARRDAGSISNAIVDVASTTGGLQALHDLASLPPERRRLAAELLAALAERTQLPEEKAAGPATDGHDPAAEEAAKKGFPIREEDLGAGRHLVAQAAAARGLDIATYLRRRARFIELRKAGTSIEDICAQLGEDRRTIHGWLAAARAAGYPLKSVMELEYGSS